MVATVESYLDFAFFDRRIGGHVDEVVEHLPYLALGVFAQRTPRSFGSLAHRDAVGRGRPLHLLRRAAVYAAPTVVGR